MPLGISEFRIWSIPRSKEEIKANATKRLTGKEQGLELYLPLNNTYTNYASDPIKTKVVDLAKGRHGKVYNAILRTSTPKVVTGSVSSIITSTNDNPGMMMFGTQNDYIDCGNSKFAWGNYTIETWFKTSATTQGAIFAAKIKEYGIRLEIRADGILHYLHLNPSKESTDVNIYSTDSYNNGKWHHLAAVKQGVSTFLYVDGVEIGSASTSIDFKQSLDVVLGKFSKTQSVHCYQGYLAELRLWKYARSPQDIQADQNLKLTGQE